MTLGGPYSLEGKRVWVAGHRGLVGSALVRRLRTERCEILTVDRQTVDLVRQDAVEQWVAEKKPQAVFMAAARVGGILANDSYPADFLYENLMIEANIINAAFRNRVEKLLFLGSSCIYPKAAPQPMSEADLLSGPLEPTNEWYAIAKIAGIKLAQSYRKQHACDFISAIPSNLYGPGDNFDLSSSHVLPALIRKAHEAKISGAPQMTIWGTGEPRREFLHVDDCADACVWLMKRYSDDGHVNVGYGSDIRIIDLARLVCRIVGFTGEIAHDLAKPDGMLKKLVSTNKMNALGWKPSIRLEDGIRAVYASFNHAEVASG